MINNFHDFLNEVVKLTVLDVMIDDDGNIYNGEHGRPLIKGNLEQERKSIAGKYENVLIGIIGSNGKKYPAGIDKNGNLVAVKIDSDGYVLNKDGSKIEINIEDERFEEGFWRVSRRGVNLDYSFLVPILSTGWVNTKIDMEIVKKVRRYGSGLGTNDRGHESFISKLKDLEKLGGVKYRQRGRELIQKQMSGIILLHYINEIKDFFTPSSAGFLFESFLGGLIPNAKVKEDNSKVDISSPDATYQIKFLTSLSTNMAIATLPDGSLLDYYVVSLKYPQKIDIYVLSGNEEDENYIGDYRTGVDHTGVSLKINDLKDVGYGFDWVMSLDLSDIDGKIERIAEGLQETLDKLYSELSKFQYNVETIISGVDEKGKIIEEDEFQNIVTDSRGNCTNMLNELNSLVSIMFPRR